jgi:hypothetical protein
MLSRLVMAVVAAVVAYLVCVIVGAVLVALAVPIAVTVGGALTQYAGIISVLVFLYYAFVGTPSWPNFRA